VDRRLCRALAMGRTPQLNPANAAQQAAIDHDLGRDLMLRTSQGPLMRELDRDIQAHPGHTPIEILAEMEALFLGADEAAAKRADLELLRQKPGKAAKDAIPAYSRTFLEAADEAYAIVGRGPEIDEKLGEMFAVSLIDRAVVKELFEHEPRLETLDATQTAAIAIYNRSRRMSRALQTYRGHANPLHEPMEVGPLEEDARDRELRRLREEVARLKATKSSQPPSQNRTTTPTNQGASNSAPSYNGPRKAGPRAQCYECSGYGHFGRDCAKRRERLAHEAATGGQ